MVQWLPILGALRGSVASFATMGIPTLWPTEFHFENFVNVWQAVPLATYILNSLFYSSVSTVLTVVVSLPGAYATTRFRFRGLGVILFVILATQMIAVSTIIVPLFQSVLRIGLFDTRIAIIFISSAMTVPLCVWLLRSYLQKIPHELEEAALLDGCTRWQTLLLIVVPLARPGIAAAAVMSFVLAYKQFFVPLVMLTSETKFPAMVGIYTLASQRVVPWHLVMAGVLIIMVPPSILFFFAQKHLVSGLSAGGLK